MAALILVSLYLDCTRSSLRSCVCRVEGLTKDTDDGARGFGSSWPRAKVSEGRGSGRRTKPAEAILYFLFFLRGYVCYVDEEGEKRKGNKKEGDIPVRSVLYESFSSSELE